MNVLIQDREPFEKLNPVDVAAYLRAEGWQEVENQPDRLSVWTTDLGGERLEVLLPLNRRLRDFASRLAELVGTLATKEDRSRLEVLSDLQIAGSDVIRVRYRHASAGDGSIPLDRGEALVENAREMMLAGACATVQTKPYYSRRRPDEAVQFVRNLRMGQTERGSYVLTIFSPVSPHLNSTMAQLFGKPEDPFERRAVETLATALGALRSATDRALTSSDGNPFESLIAKGVNANLCSAIVGMNGKDTQQQDDLRISFTFARSRPAERDIPREIVFPSHHMGVIEEAARLYKAAAPPEEVEIRGIVVQLKTEDPNAPVSGPATVSATVDGKVRRIQIPLENEGHRLAVQAYEKRLVVVCTGELMKQGNALVLRNPRGFNIVPEE